MLAPCLTKSAWIINDSEEKLRAADHQCYEILEVAREQPSKTTLVLNMVHHASLSSNFGAPSDMTPSTAQVQYEPSSTALTPSEGLGWSDRGTTPNGGGLPRVTKNWLRPIQMERTRATAKGTHFVPEASSRMIHVRPINEIINEFHLHRLLRRTTFTPTRFRLLSQSNWRRSRPTSHHSWSGSTHPPNLRTPGGQHNWH